MVPGRRLEFKAWEAAGAALALLVGIHFLAMRVRAGGLPGGDEGSWLSVSAELARGHGWSTRWLELHFLRPYALPRPDDLRYPALTSLLAVVFRGLGTSVEIGRWTVTAVFLSLAGSVWLICRRAFGRWAALGALWLTLCSLLQLQWNTVVYTEGLFGLVVAGLAWWCLKGESPRAARRGSMTGIGGPLGSPVLTEPAWWAVLGAGVGLLYLVRPNGLLFVPGILWLYWRRRHLGLTWKHPALALTCFGLVIAPWLLRTAHHFGNPLHIAGNAGMLREAGQPHTYTLFQYLAQHNPWYPLQRFLFGVPRFFRILHQSEHGLEALPLLAAAAAVFLRRPFFGPFLASGFLISGLICCYAAYDGWAPIRYMSSLLPFLYAYGLAALRSLFRRRFPSASKRSGFLTGCAVILLLLLPVVQPHRYYERTLKPAPGFSRHQAAYLDSLQARVAPGESYYAGSLCAINFLTQGRRCVGLQELYDPTWFSRSMEAFHPRLVALTHGETADTAMQAALAKMRREGYTADTLAVLPLGVLLALSPGGGK